MFRFLLFPKLFSQYKSTQNQALYDECVAVMIEYNIIGSELKNTTLELDAQVDHKSLDVLDHKVEDMLRENQEIKPSFVMYYLPKFYIAMQFKELNLVLSKILLGSNNMEILTWIYITQMYQSWFEEEETHTAKTIKNNHKKIQSYRMKNQTPSKELAVLFQLVDILHYFNNFKQMGVEPSSHMPDLEFLKSAGFLDEYLMVYLIDSLIKKPFNGFQLEDDFIEALTKLAPNLVQLSNNVKQLSLIDFELVKPEFNLVSFLFPSACNMSFPNYFVTILKCKWFLNLMSFTSRISTQDVRNMLGDAEMPDDINQFVLLIGSLSLSQIGIGYDVTTETFYNSDKESNSLNYDLRAADHLLKAQAYASMLRDDLVNSVME
ncbi:hypothetical protein PSN45_001061 [Yamadazyma tenuis]|uniref:uncharacterized protein n=1 Tax=Candida tenuis TaxID=2315449 RepID=UPI00279D52A4|nr:hypothetical protein PSN45_001061 [Yamadazyma tenuis]